MRGNSALGLREAAKSIEERNLNSLKLMEATQVMMVMLMLIEDGDGGWVDDDDCTDGGSTQMNTDLQAYHEGASDLRHQVESFAPMYIS